MSVNALEYSSRTRRSASRWIMPILIVMLVAGTLIYTQVADLDSSEARSLDLSLILLNLRQHIQLVVVSTFLTIAIGVPLGVLLTRRGTRYLSAPILAVASAGQAVPSIGLLVLLAIVFGVGFKMAVVALVVYALLPVLRNTMVGIRQVDPAIVDAGRGMGMNSWEVLRAIELPLATPVMLAGIRVALILNVGVATLATYTNAGGLGSIIAAGIHLNRLPVLVVGSLLTIALALTVDWAASIAEQVLRPKGI
ncbi:ABC transporter permease [Rhodococcus xishaensis]|uniref:ABC transporter permease n=1 Tax=Rhodococcus xishaensis TaxID=2487364 RepID=A0A438AQD3_9NOCA|nr:ABC transporter permease [Rhodococcus xishaensis]RVW00744.1 ABC transporter permease [Rhodococcus xishaensis]